MVWNAFILMGLFIVTTFSVFIALRSRKAHRWLWKEHEDLKKAFCEFKRTTFDANRGVYGSLVKTLTGLEKISFNAQHGEDFFLMNSFDFRRNGFFIEVGAFDGVSFSNTAAFADLGWKGILIEADPDQVEKCRRNRPESVTVHAAVGGAEANGEITFHSVKGNGTEVLSFVAGDEQHLARCRAEGAHIDTVVVPFFSLRDILSAQKISLVIDFMTIDVEGFELEVLQGNDWNLYSPKVVIVENNSNNIQIAGFMTTIGYELITKIECNELYKKWS